VLARKAVGFGCVFNEDGRRTFFYELCIALLEFVVEKRLPACLELVGILVE